MLDNLKANPLVVDAENAWRPIGSIYENTPDMIFDTRRPIHVAVANLGLKAYTARETALKNANMDPMRTPNFITQLRQKRETATARIRVRDAKNSPPGRQANHDQAKGCHVVPRQDAGGLSSADRLRATNLPQSTSAHLSGILETGGGTI